MRPGAWRKEVETQGRAPSPESSGKKNLGVLLQVLQCRLQLLIDDMRVDHRRG